MNESPSSLASVSASKIWPRISWIALLLLLTIAYRVGAASRPDLANTAPLMAVCFGGGLLLGWRFCWVPALLLFASDLFLGFTHDIGISGYTLASALIYTLVGCAGAAIGQQQRTRPGQWWVMLVGTWTASLLFYVLSNTYAWTVSPVYVKSLAGWWQSQTVGLPGPYPPALFFLKNALIGATVWSVLAAPLFFWRPVRTPDAAAMDDRAVA